VNAPFLTITHRTIADESVQTIDSAGLHEYLDVTTEHGKWIARRIASYGFIEGSDYVCSPEVAGKAPGRRKQLSDFESQRFRHEMIAGNPGRRGCAVLEALRVNAQQEAALVSNERGQLDKSIRDHLRRR